MVLPATDRSLLPPLVAQGFFEPELTNFVIKHVRPGQTVVDAGANVGYVSLLLARKVGKTGHVIAYEPNPNLVPWIRENMALNYVSEIVDVRPKAVYASRAQLDFNVLGKFSGQSSICDREFRYDEKVTRVQAEAEPLDDLRETFEHVDLVKLDIEGAELHAFLGMQEMLARGAVDTIVFEWNRVMMKNDVYSFVYLLAELQEKHGMKLCAPDPHGDLHPLSLSQLQQLEFHSAIVLTRL